MAGWEISYKHEGFRGNDIENYGEIMGKTVWMELSIFVGWVMVMLLAEPRVPTHPDSMVSCDFSLDSNHWNSKATHEEWLFPSFEMFLLFFVHPLNFHPNKFSTE